MNKRLLLIAASLVVLAFFIGETRVISDPGNPGDPGEKNRC